MRQWTKDDVDRWQKEIRESELSYIHQLEIVHFCSDLFEVCNKAGLEVDRLRKLLVGVSRPLTAIMWGVESLDEGLLDEAGLVSLLRFHVEDIKSVFS